MLITHVGSMRRVALSPATSNYAGQTQSQKSDRGWLRNAKNYKRRTEIRGAVNRSVVKQDCVAAQIYFELSRAWGHEVEVEGANQKVHWPQNRNQFSQSEKRCEAFGLIHQTIGNCFPRLIPARTTRRDLGKTNSY